MRKPKIKTALELEVDKFLNKTSEEEAWNRKYFIDHISSVLIGGLIEFYKSRLGSKNGQVKNVKGWHNEAERIVRKEFARNLLHPVKGFNNYNKAFEEIKSDVFSNDDKIRLYAAGLAEQTYKIEMKNQLEDSDTDLYRDMMIETFTFAKSKAFKDKSPQVKKPPTRGNSFNKKK